MGNAGETGRDGSMPSGRTQYGFCGSKGSATIFGSVTSAGSEKAGTPIAISRCGTFNLSVPCSQSQTVKPLDQFELVSSRTCE